MDKYFISFSGVNLLPVTVWAKLYRSNLLIEAFKELSETAEISTGAGDLIMSLYIHPYISRLSIINDIVYYYNIGLPGVSPKYLKSWLKNASNLFRLKWSMLEKYSYKKGEKTLAIEMVNYIKTYISNSTIFDKANRYFHITELQEVLKDPIWQRIGVLKDSTYKDQQIVSDILTQNLVHVYQEIELRTLNVSFKIKIKNMILRLFAKIR